MADAVMEKIDEALMIIDVHELADMCCRAHEHEREAGDSLARLFYGAIRNHIAQVVAIKLKSEADDER